MANKNFRVKHGLEVDGDIDVTGGDITTTATTASIFNSTATTVNAFGAATTTNIGAKTGSSIVNGTNRFTSPTTYGFLGGATSPNRGYMQSNGNASSFATVRNNIAVRSYPTAAGVSARGGMIFENARGNETTPAAIQTNDLIGEINATGYATNGYVSDFIAVLPGLSYFQPVETWANTGGPFPTAGTVTNAGLGYVIALQPSATTLSTTSRINVMNISPQTFNTRSDAYNFNSKAGVTNVSIDSSGNMILTGDLRVNGNNIQGSGGLAAIDLTSANTVTTVRGDTINLQTAASVGVTGNNITYNRVYGQFQYDTTVTPAAANTAYVFPLGVQDFGNIVTVGSTSRLIPGAAGMYNLQFSLQAQNADNANDHTVYIWLRRNGSDVAGSMGRFTVIKDTAGSLKIAGWNYLVDPANTTDYFEIAYAVSDTDVTFPAFAATAFGPSTATIITTLTPVGA